MVEQEQSRKIRGFVKIDDAYRGGERNDGKVGRRCENKQPFVIAVSMNANLEHPMFAVIEPVRAFDNASLSDWVERRLEPDVKAFTDGLGCFRQIGGAGRAHTLLETSGGRTSTQVAGARWLNVLLSNLKRALDGVHHAIRQSQVRSPLSG